jgi:chemosensory pili system protein ChpA (sensor histidine kinase/response regulator)
MPTMDADILASYSSEVVGYFPIIRRCLAEFVANPADRSTIEEAYRCAHTIHGASGMVGLVELEEPTAMLEAAIDALQQSETAPDSDTVAMIELQLETVEQMVNAVIQTTTEAPTTSTNLAANDDTLTDFPAMPFPDFPVSATDDDALAFPSFEQTAPTSKPKQPDIATELLEVFRMEAEDDLRVLTKTLPRAKKETVAKDDWLEVRRAAHTLKGAAAMVGFAEVTTLAHGMEDLLDAYYEGGRTATPDEVDWLLASTDGIDDVINGRAGNLGTLLQRGQQFLGTKPMAPAPVSKPKIEEPAEVVEERRAEPNRPDANEAYVRIPLTRLNDIVKMVGELVISRTAFEQRMTDMRQLLQELEPTTTRLKRVSTKIETGYEAITLAGTKAEATTDGFDALEFDRYTEFHLLSRELAETTSDIQALDGELGHLHSDFVGHLTRQSRLGSEIEDKLMRLRMVPISSVATKLQRTVRQACETTQKKAELVLKNERTGLDKSVLEALADPLLHLLRNAVDHGLETPEVRRALGKPENGTIELQAGYEGSNIVLTLSDDGRGVNLDQVRQTAIRRGVLNEAANPGSDELLELLFAPGFSTKDEVSELSGRGVGLDVVRSKVEALKGSVHLSMKPGQGTSFTIRLPMTLAMTRALLVKANGQTFAIPLDAVEMIVRPDASELTTVGNQVAYRVGEKVYPIRPLAQVLRLKTGGEPTTTDRTPVVLLKSRDQLLGVSVDQLLGGREIIIKNLGSHLKRAPGLSGSTLLGDGTVVLILNPTELLKRVQTTSSRNETTTSNRSRAGITALIVDDSPSVRRVLTMLVERQGWTAITAKDGLDALETLQAGRVVPSVILSDVEMPRMDGYELLGTVRSQMVTRHIPMVMITSRSADKHRARAMELGANAYVTKPYQDESLLDLIRTLCARAEASR